MREQSAAAPTGEYRASLLGKRPLNAMAVQRGQTADVVTRVQQYSLIKCNQFGKLSSQVYKGLKQTFKFLQMIKATERANIT